MRATRLRRSVLRLLVSAGGGSRPSRRVRGVSWCRSRSLIETWHHRSAARIMVANTSFIADFSSPNRPITLVPAQVRLHIPLHSSNRGTA
jgi:hypothetical protein